MVICDVGESANLKVFTINKLRANRKSKWFEIPHYT
jgi:hypothetical protein